MLRCLVVTALGFAACVPVGAGANKPRSERPVAAGLVVALDGRGVETLGDGSTRIARRGPDPFQIVATTDVVRHPYPGETVTAILTSGERVVKQAPFVFDAVHGRVRIEVPAPGTYRLELWSAERFLGGNTFVAASLPTLDGQRVLELHQDAGPQLILTRETAHLRWMHWDSVEADTGFVAEWWQDGKRIAPAGGKRSEFQREALAYVQATDQVEALAKQSVWRWTSEQFALPDDVITRAEH